MDKKTKEDLRRKIAHIQFDAKMLVGHLDTMANALDKEDWDVLRSTVYQQHADLQQIVPSIISLGQQLVQLVLNNRIEHDAPWKLAALTHVLLYKYLNLHGGVYEAIYAQLKRAIEIGQNPNSTERITQDDPEIIDLATRIGAELEKLKDAPTPEAVRLTEIVELCAAVLSLICEDTPTNRTNVHTAFSTVIRQLPDASTALELLQEG
jgi:hypothetical protein